MLRLITLLFVLSFPLSPETAAAQDPRLTARLDSLTLTGVDSLLTLAQRRGIPAEPLVQKALEGSSKGAPGPRIVSAVGAMLGDLTRAQQALGRKASPEEMVAGAAALRAGATAEMVDQLRRNEHGGGVAVPLAVFADLVAGGMTVDAAWQSVEELARKGGDDEEFLQLRERLRPRGYSQLSRTSGLSGTLDLHTGPVAWDHADSGEPLLDGRIEAGYLIPTSSPIRPELLGSFGLMTGPSQAPGMGWDLGARLHAGGSSGGAWLGVAFGAAGIGSPERSLVRLEGGVRRALGPAHVNLWLSRTGFGSSLPGLGQDTATDTLSRRGITDYTDLGSKVAFDFDRYQLGLSLVRRIGREVARRTGWELNGTWWLAPNTGLVGSAGHSLPQVGFGVPGGRYGTLGLRFALGAASRGQTRPSEAAKVKGPAVVLSGRVLTITSAPARKAEVMGDFSDWKPVPLEPAAAGEWVLPVTLSPGVHQLNVRFDGGAWQVPAGAYAVDDGFGGRVGMIVVR